MPTPSVNRGDSAATKLKRGFDTMARLLATTMGPTRGVTLSAKTLDGPPEVLGDAATIARRVLALPDRREDVGAMLMRQIVWRMRQRYGDGAATTAVLARAILDQGTRLKRAGYEPVDVERGVRRAAKRAVAEIEALAQPDPTWETLAAVGRAATGHAALGDAIAEMVDLLGPDGHITVEDAMSPQLERVYLDGGRWRAELLSPYFITVPSRRQAALGPVDIVMFAGRISQPADIVPAVDRAVIRKAGGLLVVAFEIAPAVRDFLVQVHTDDNVPLKVVAVKLARGGVTGITDLEDMALLCGGSVLAAEKGQPLDAITDADFGRSRRVVADKSHLQLSQGRGRAAAVRAAIADLQRRVNVLPPGDTEHDAAHARLARLAGNTGLLKIGALTKAERTAIHQHAEQGILAVKAAARGGTVAGGGTVYLRAAQAIAPWIDTLPEAERPGARGLAAALSAPFDQLLRNAGETVPAVTRAAVLEQPAHVVYDVLRQRLCPAVEADAVDAAAIAAAALETAASGALVALSIDAVVLKRRPRMSYEP